MQLSSVSLIAGNCRLLTFIKTINKFTHIFPPNNQNVAIAVGWKNLPQKVAAAQAT